jgi:hypothetical protein
MRPSAALGPLLAALAAAGCIPYKHRTTEARGAFYAGNYQRSAELYSGDAFRPGREQLLYLLDAGMALHSAKRYAESNRCFLAADRLIEDLNFVHVGAEAASIVFDDRAVPYQGEEFEDVLVNVFAALNFILAGGPKGPEEALVECRRLDWKLREFSELRGRKYLQNAFARYLSGLAYELDNEPNDAYIDYKMVHKLRPDFAPVRMDLVRLARSLGFADDAEQWEKKFGLRYDPAAERGSGEVVLVYQCGRAPEKVPRDDLLDLPFYVPRAYRDKAAEVVVNDRALGRTQVLEDIEATALRTLADRMGPIVAKRLASLALKTGAAVGVHELVRKNTKHGELADAAGFFVFMLLKSLDQADTRSWLTLPANLQVARVRLSAGTHTLRVIFLDAAGAPTGHQAEFLNVPVRPGAVTLLVTRTLQ